jgi:uncharacterized protein with PIN domain
MRFVCDAMLGGLSRWLRAVGYEAAFDARIDDGDLVARAAREGAAVLSSDAPLFERKLLRSGLVRGLFVPRHAPIDDQLVFVMRHFRLEVRDARCMRCGGALAEAPRDAVRDEAPPRAWERCDRFWRCEGCSGLFWHGTHWTRIAAARDAVAAPFRQGPWLPSSRTSRSRSVATMTRSSSARASAA